jgi:hypothetical protein
MPWKHFCPKCRKYLEQDLHPISAAYTLCPRERTPLALAKTEHLKQLSLTNGISKIKIIKNFYLIFQLKCMF